MDLCGSIIFIDLQDCKFLFEKTTSILAAMLWILYPFATTRFITVSMTLDGLDVFFSLLIIYVACKWMVEKQDWQIYILGFCCGLGILAKYNVIVIILAIMLYFLINKDTRVIYLKYQLYIAMLLALAIFSPVILWNYEHGWSSFLYQLNSHKWDGPAGAINSYLKYGMRGVWFFIGSAYIGVLHIYIALIIYTSYIYNKSKVATISKSPCRNLLVFIIIAVSLFWFAQSYSKHVALNYITALSATVVIFVAEGLMQTKNYVLIKIILVLFAITSVAMCIDKSRLHSTDLPNYIKYVRAGLVGRGL